MLPDLIRAYRALAPESQAILALSPAALAALLGPPVPGLLLVVLGLCAVLGPLGAVLRYLPRLESPDA